MAKIPQVILFILLGSSLYAADAMNAPDANTHEDSVILAELIVPAGASIAAPLTVVREQARRDRIYEASRFAFIASVAADLGTTQISSKRTAECNPLLGKNKTKQLAISGALGFLTLWEAHALQNHGHRTLSRYMLGIGTALHSFAAMHNAMQ